MWRPSLLLLPETQHQKPGGLKQHRRSILTFIVVSWPFPSIFKMHLSSLTQISASAITSSFALTLNTHESLLQGLP